MEPTREADPNEARARTHCPYCALQCGMVVREDAIAGDESFPVNRGALCVKGFHAAATLAHPERITTPLVRDAKGALVPASWDAALDFVAERIIETRARFGADAIGVFGSGALTNEKTYLLGKLARVAIGTANIDYNGRFCMSSAAAASTRAFGLDRGLPFPLDDVAHADVVMLVGGNVAETMPPLMQYLQAQRERGGALVVVDPRRTSTALEATLHLRLTPGTDATLANGILHVLVRDGLVDERYVEARTDGFAAAKALVASFWPERVERITGVPQADVVRAAHLLGEAKRAIVLTGRGAEQQACGVANTLAFIDVALAIGAPGTRGSGFGCVTGQGNGQGGREHGQKCDQLPGYRRIDDPAARAHMAKVWGVDEAAIPRAGLSAFELLSACGDRVRALFVMGSNVVVSSPDATTIEARLRALDLLVVCDFFVSETAAIADVVLPSAQWAEEDGTTTNLEGRVIRRRRVREPLAGTKTDLEILCALAARLGHAERFASSDAPVIFDELRRASTGGIADYAGITYERIDREHGVFWPCPSEDHPGTPRLFEARFATESGRARFHAIAPLGPAEEPDDAYPLFLTTGRIMAHYQSGTQTRRVRALVQMAPHALAEMHKTTARRLGLCDGDSVRLETRRGSSTFVLQTTTHIREDTVFVPFHFGGAECANRLTNPALDPTSRMPELKVCAVRAMRAPVAIGGRS